MSQSYDIDTALQNSLHTSLKVDAGRKYRVDSFQEDVPEVFITHAHHDHMKGTFKKTKVYCTPRTGDLLRVCQPRITHLETHGFFEPFFAAGQVVVFFPTFHMPGSAMVFFVQEGLLHVGDHIPRPKFWYYLDKVLEILKKENIAINQVIIDNTFHVQAKLISFPETASILKTIVNDLLSKQDVVSLRVYNLSIIPILSTLGFDKSEIYVDTDTFSKKSTIPNQFVLLGIPDKTSPATKIKLTRSDQDENCIILSSLWFLCTLRNTTETLQEQQDENKIRVCYATHARHYDNMHLVQSIRFRNNGDLKTVFEGEIKKNLPCKK
jgi:hypothetical protein